MAALEASGLGLVEIGGYQRVRSLAFGRSTPHEFEIRQPGAEFVVGVSRDGAGLILRTRKAERGAIHSGLDIVSTSGDLRFHVSSRVTSIGAIGAELSPNGRKVLFVGSFAFPKARGLNLIDEDGDVRNLVNLEEQDYPTGFAWSSAGDEVVYDTRNRIYIFSIRGLTARLLVDGNSPAWSPDGQWIAYRKVDGRPGMISPDGGRTHALLDGTRFERGLAWSPDGHYLLFTDAASYEIRVFDVSNGAVGTISCPLDGWVGSRLRWIRIVQ